MEFHAGDVKPQGDGRTTVQIMACTETTCAMMNVLITAEEISKYASLGENAAAIVEKACGIVHGAVGDRVTKCKTFDELSKLAKLQ